MKVEVDILGAEQAMDFETLVSAQYLVLDIFGVRVRVPITEEQMSALVAAAVSHKTATPSEEPWVETRETSAEAPTNLVSTPIPEQGFSLISGLMEQGDEPVVEPGVFEDPDAEKERKLRERRPRRMVMQDDAGNPVVPVHAALPPAPGFGPLSDDDGFAQG